MTELYLRATPYSFVGNNKYSITNRQGYPGTVEDRANGTSVDDFRAPDDLQLASDDGVRVHWFCELRTGQVKVDRQPPRGLSMYSEG